MPSINIPPPPTFEPSDPPETVEQEWVCVTDEPSRAYGRLEPGAAGGEGMLLHDYAVLTDETLARLGGQPARIKITLEVLK